MPICAAAVRKDCHCCHKVNRTSVCAFPSFQALACGRWLVLGQWLSLVARQTPRVNKCLRSWMRNLLDRSWGHLRGGALPSVLSPAQEAKQDSVLSRILPVLL